MFWFCEHDTQLYGLILWHGTRGKKMRDHMVVLRTTSTRFFQCKFIFFTDCFRPWATTQENHSTGELKSISGSKSCSFLFQQFAVVKTRNYVLFFSFSSDFIQKLWQCFRYHGVSHRANTFFDDFVAHQVHTGNHVPVL